MGENKCLQVSTYLLYMNRLLYMHLRKRALAGGTLFVGRRKNAGMTDIIHRNRLTEMDFALGWNLNAPNENHCKHADIAHSDPIHPAVLAPTFVPVEIRFNRL